MLKISNKIYPYIWLIGIILLAFILYFPVISFGWITGTDQAMVIDNQLLRSLSTSNLVDILFSAEGGQYQPLGLISLALDINLSTGSANKMIHIVNLILHLLNIILFFRFLQLLGSKLWMTIFAVSLFAVHPMNSEAIVLISSRSYLLGAFLLLMGLQSYLYSIKASLKRKRYFNISMIFFILAVFTHPVAVVFPFATILLDRIQNRNLRQAINEKIPMIMISLLFIVIGIVSQWGLSYTNTQNAFTVTEKIMYLPNVISAYLLKTVFPYGQSVYHPVPAGFTYFHLGELLATIFIFIVFLKAGRKNRILFFALMFFIVSVMIEALLSINAPGLYVEKAGYIPCLGLFIVMGSIIQTIYEKLHKMIGMYAIMMIILFGGYTLLMAYFTYDRSGIYRNSEKAWTQVIERYPDDGHAYFMRGDYWAMNARFDRAKFDYSQCIRRNPNAFEAINNIGLIYMQEGDLRLAISEFNKAIEVNETFYKSHLNKGIVYMRLENNELALQNISHAIELNPDNSLGYYNRGLVYERLNALEDATADFSQAIDRDPGQVIYYKDRGKAYVWMGQYDLAEVDFTRALDLDPSNAEMWFRRSLVRTSQDKFRGGLEDALMAKNLGFQVEEEYIKGLAVQALKDDLPVSEQ